MVPGGRRLPGDAKTMCFYVQNAFPGVPITYFYVENAFRGGPTIYFYVEKAFPGVAGSYQDAIFNDFQPQLEKSVQEASRTLFLMISGLSSKNPSRSFPGRSF